MQGYVPCPSAFIKRLRDLQESVLRDFFLASQENRLWMPDWTPPSEKEAWLRDFIWDIDIFGTPQKVNVEKTIAHQKRQADNAYIRLHSTSFYRTTGRTAYLRDELFAGAEKMRTVRRCHQIKEELCANVYHPRRIEKLLETGGWEVLDNFAGL